MNKIHQVHRHLFFFLFSLKKPTLENDLHICLSHPHRSLSYLLFIFLSSLVLLTMNSSSSLLFCVFLLSLSFRQLVDSMNQPLCSHLLCNRSITPQARFSSFSSRRLLRLQLRRLAFLSSEYFFSSLFNITFNVLLFNTRTFSSEWQKHTYL